MIDGLFLYIGCNRQDERGVPCDNCLKRGSLCITRRRVAGSSLSKIEEVRTVPDYLLSEGVKRKLIWRNTTGHPPTLRRHVQENPGKYYDSEASAVSWLVFALATYI